MVINIYSVDSNYIAAKQCNRKEFNIFCNKIVVELIESYLIQYPCIYYFHEKQLVTI